MTIKACKDCLKELDIEMFDHQTNKKGDFVRSVCRKCQQLSRNVNTSKTPESFIKNLYTQLKSTRRNSEYKWDITVEYLYQLYKKQDGKCAISGVNMTWHKGSGKTHYNISIDRKNPDLDYVPTNVQLVCVITNIMKHTLNDVDFYWWCKTIVDNKEKNI